MIETADVRLARVEEKLDTLVLEVASLRGDMRQFGERITRLEESTREAVPQVWPLRERVAQLERETADLRLRLHEMEQAQTKLQDTRGSRWWDVARAALSPAIAAVVTWMLMRRL